MTVFEYVFSRYSLLLGLALGHLLNGLEGCGSAQQSSTGRGFVNLLRTWGKLELATQLAEEARAGSQSFRNSHARETGPSCLWMPHPAS